MGVPYQVKKTDRSVETQKKALWLNSRMNGNEVSIIFFIFRISNAKH